MRSDPRDFELVTPATLGEALQLLARETGSFTPIAGGTDLMVQFAAGALRSRKLLSLWNLPELRKIEATPEELRIGAGSTYTDLRCSYIVTHEFPLLARAASWTGGIANQSRGTLGGNIVNASPAADSLPPLLAYEAELTLVSVRGERRVPYTAFHSAYKKMELLPGELIKAICLPRRYSGYLHYSRKVGARSAQAISKVCIAAIARMDNDIIDDIRIAIGSVAPVPLRLARTEEFLRVNSVNSETIAKARQSAAAEIAPIDDIRSNSRYRAAVVGNLLEEFLTGLASGAKNATLARWNLLPSLEAEREILACCASSAWASTLAGQRPFAAPEQLIAASDAIWRELSESDWLEAFRSHPRIGESHAAQPRSERAAKWSEREQSGAASVENDVKLALAEANREYERRFGYIFIVCASGRGAGEMLDILQLRLHNDPRTELREAAEQQRQITNLRLTKWLSEDRFSE